MSKYLRREVAAKNAVYQAILEACSTRLAEIGYFSKDEILETTGMEAFDDSIRWDYIVDFLRHGQGVELVPMAQRFFNRHKASDRIHAPQLFIASGHGKKTMGYANVTIDGGVFAIKQLRDRKSLQNGVGKAYREYAERLHERQLIDDNLMLKIYDGSATQSDIAAGAIVKARLPAPQEQA
jgi:hypothetical protein